jgi:hypothetical protein
MTARGGTRRRDVDVEAHQADDGALILQAVGDAAAEAWIRCERPRELGEWA